MVPHISKAKELEYGIVVANPNQNVVMTPEGMVKIPGSESPEDHTIYVWDKVLGGVPEGTPIDIIAHSNGGRCFLTLLAERPDVLKRVRRVVFTDSFHHPQQVEALNPEAKAFLETRTVNYVPSDAPLGTPVETWSSLRHDFHQKDRGCPCVSAETNDHASTNFTSLDPTFKFFADGAKA
jgi:pimeloyl-ACP methyl ester carboxylesterase